MGWEDASSTAIDIKKDSQVHEGVYIGKKSITTKIGPQVIWDFEGDDGNFGIYGFTNLNNCMEAIKEGTKVRIQYKGTKNVPTKFGMKDVHQVSVQRWKDESQPEEDQFP